MNRDVQEYFIRFKKCKMAIKDLSNKIFSTSELKLKSQAETIMEEVILMNTEFMNVSHYYISSCKKDETVSFVVPDIELEIYEVKLEIERMKERLNSLINLYNEDLNV